MNMLNIYLTLVLLFFASSVSSKIEETKNISIQKIQDGIQKIKLPSQGTNSWGTWSSCSVSCGKGIQKRKKYCINQGNPFKPFLQARRTSNDCLTQTQTKSCTRPPCNKLPSQGMNSWTTWSSCSVSCGRGVKRRTKCINQGHPSKPFLQAKIIPIDCETQTQTKPCTRPVCRYGKNPEENGDKFEGDMVLTNEQMSELNQNKLSRRKRNTLVDTNRHWTNNIVYYQFATGSGAHTSSQKNQIKAAMNHIRTVTNQCVKFQESGAPHKHVIFTRQDSGCFSNVGMQPSSSQNINLANGCFNPGTIQHEILHALGLFHEQSRSDRNTYVTIKLNNVIPDKVNNFNTYSNSYITHFGDNYDYGSVMHYSSKAFSKNDQETIIPTDPNIPASSLGQRDGMSETDITRLMTMYKCSSQGFHQNTYDNPMHFTCGANKYIWSIRSTWSAHHEDRIWRYNCRTSNAQLKDLDDCYFLFSWRNWFEDKYLNYQCHVGGAMTGMYSIHKNTYEDRRWNLKCCSVKNCIPTNCQWSGATTAFSTMHYVVPQGFHLNGVKAERVCVKKCKGWWIFKKCWTECDRVWKFRICKPQAGC